MRIAVLTQQWSILLLREWTKVFAAFDESELEKNRNFLLLLGSGGFLNSEKNRGTIPQSKPGDETVDINC